MPGVKSVKSVAKTDFGNTSKGVEAETRTNDLYYAGSTTI